MFVRRLLIVFVALLFLSACKDDSKLVSKSAKKKKILIYTSIQPLAFISSKIAGRYAKVKALIPKGKSPHSFTLLGSDLSSMSKARFFFSVRLPFEELQLKKVFENSATEWVDITKGIKFHGHDEHACGSMDPHIWLDPENDVILARNICDTLSKTMPQNKKYFERNFENFARCINLLDAKLKKTLEPFKGEIFLVYHPAFGYFTRRYGLIQESIELGGRSPSAKHLQKVIS
ncbi:MAG: zinc ABC transporter substrate-binding protein, partial [Victivallales bacterium]|nr:zinc ABC transporter substrate-binding protein [Victivallales bacterium]